MWFFYSVLAAFLWAIVNYCDKYLIEKYCKNRSVGALIIYSALVAIPFAILIFLLKTTEVFIDMKSSLIMIIAGAFYIFTFIPYLYALEKDETSTVAPLFLFTPALSTILAFFFLGESVSPLKIIAIAMVTAGALLISTDLKQFTFKKEIFILMLVTSFMHAASVVVFKKVAVEGDFWATAFWEFVGIGLAGVFLFAFIKSYREDFIDMVKTNSSAITIINVFSESITIFGNLLVRSATLLAPVALVQTASEGIQPFIVLAFGILLTKLFPQIIEEDVSSTKISQKIIAFTVMFVGITILST